MDIKVTKGLDLKLNGEPEKVLKEADFSEIHSVSPSEFHGITPKLSVKAGDKVKVGSPIFFSKQNPEFKITSPVSGEIKEIIRGEKRKLLSIEITADKTLEYQEFDALDLAKASREEVLNRMLESGAFSFLRQRPYDICANPTITPKAIFIQGYDSSPLSPDLDYITNGKKKELQAGVNALKKLTTGKVHLSIGKYSNAGALSKLSGVEIHTAKGPHPVGNHSTQIEKIDPINKGEFIWTLGAPELIQIGNLFLNHKMDFTKIIALCGSQVKTPHYIKTISGASINNITNKLIEGDNNRFINGNVLTGSITSKEGYILQNARQITVIPEGDDYQFFGWQLPQANKFSILRAAMFSWLTPNKKYTLDTNTNGEHRALVLTGHFEKVFPLNIHPMHFLKACLTQDLDALEGLGAYEVAPEDFALTEFIDVSKNNHQELVRETLDLMIKEIG